MDSTLIGLAGVLASAAPVLIAVLGETITERSGITNLSLNGTVLLAAMLGFAAAQVSGNLYVGFLAGMAVGAAIALIVAFGSIALRQSQVAIGFVLALATRDLATFLGVPFMNIPGPTLGKISVPVLADIPVLGVLLFQHNLITYFSFALVFLVWLWIFRTRPGLTLQGIGERPAAAYVRGANVELLRYVYTAVGGALVGIAGPAYTLGVKGQWQGTQTGLDGIGWIALSITIFGGWNPLRAALGAYLFSLLQWLGIVLQPLMPGIPGQVLQVAPFPLMILTLLLVNVGDAPWVERSLAGMPETTRRRVSKLLRSLRAAPPSALGVPYVRGDLGK